MYDTDSNNRLSIVTQVDFEVLFEQCVLIGTYKGYSFEQRFQSIFVHLE
jgi:hypothetical protein